MDEKEYFKLCRICTDNYLQLENTFFKFADIIYVYDDWEGKSKIFTMQLANLHISICSGIEEGVKFLLINPKYNLITQFNSYIDSLLTIDNKFKKKIKEDLSKNKLDNIKLHWILDFNDFRKKLNQFSECIVFSKPPLRVLFENNFGQQDKPEWFKIYEDLKHNFFSKYPEATLKKVFEALAAYYLIAKIIAHEASFIANSNINSNYFPWHEANIDVNAYYQFGSRNNINKFNSKHFEFLRLVKKVI